MLIIKVNQRICNDCGGCSQWFKGMPETAFNGHYVESVFENCSVVRPYIDRLPQFCVYEALEVWDKS